MTEYKKLTDEELIRRLRMGETGIIDYLMENLDKQYRIELYNPDLSENDKGYYNIRRNTIYRVFATLKGPGNMEYDIVVDEWKDTEVAIPW